MRIKIGTRGSKLALLQTQSVASKIRSHRSDLEVEIVTIKTSGDVGKERKEAGRFVKEVNEKVLRGDVDIGVHSLKDLPTRLPEHISLICFPERLTPNDCLVAPGGQDIYHLPKGAVIGTGSPRRIAEISMIRPDLRFKKIRGNVDTRIKKIEDGGYHGLITSMAALERLGLEEKATYRFEFEEVVPAAGQGSLAVVTRRDERKLDFLKAMDDKKTRVESVVERTFLGQLGLSCKARVGVLAQCEACGTQIKVVASFHHEERRHLVKLRGKDPVKLGRDAAKRIQDGG